MKAPTLFFFYLTFSCALSAQTAVTRIYSDFNGWWTTASNSPSTVAPNNNHNLIAFTTNGQVYSTGVNDDLLIQHGVNFTAQVFKGLPMASIGSGGLLGIGSAIPENQVTNNPSLYLTDGVQGLNLGTAVFNVFGSNSYTITNINAQAIGDGIPDIIIPQLGDVSGTDKFKFLDENNVILGIEKAIGFGGVASVGNANWKFYTRANPPQAGAAAAGNRAIRMVAYDFADFGITTANFQKVKYFIHQLSGTSDQAFIAYNATSFDILPIELGNFDVIKTNKEVEIYWSSHSELNNDYYTVERSSDAITWESIAKIFSKGEYGNSNNLLTYEHVDTNPLKGHNYYRLKQTDFDGTESFSSIKNVHIEYEEKAINIYPNPTTGILAVEGLEEELFISISTIHGQVMWQEHNFTHSINISNLPSAMYIISISDKKGNTYTKQLIKQ